MLNQLRQLAVFAKTHEHGSFRGAARDVRFSPSVVSHYISPLEEALGVALLYRSTRRFALTPEGARRLEATQPLLNGVESEIQTVTQQAPEPAETFA